ncbi:MAG: cellobiose phosphorylase, partial [Christensenella sp.]
MILIHKCDGPEFLFEHSTYKFLKTGEVYAFTYDNLLVNSCIGNDVDGGAANLWLRIHTKDGVKYKALIDASNDNVVEQSEDCLKFTGKALGVCYTVLFRAADTGWFWNVTLSGNGEIADVIYGQDIGMADTGAELENELYSAQYLGHTIFKGEHGYAVCSRQNMPQNGLNPYLQIGMICGNAVSYSTDAMQFFGTSYKTTNVPAALEIGLEGKNYQFECSYIALQSEKVTLDSPQELAFYGFVQQNCAKAVTELGYQEQIIALNVKSYDDIFIRYTADKKKKIFGKPYSSQDITKEILDEMFPQKNLQEESDGRLLSFFGNYHEHIVLKEKEMFVERPHANIITTFLNTEKVDNELFSSTCCIYGQFNGQTVVGNTSKHKLLSTPRGLLNIMKNSGMRLWICLDGIYRLLTMPAVFETGINYCKWVYILPQDILTVTSFAVAHSVDIVTHVQSAKKHEYNFILTMQLVMGTHEFLQDIHAEQSGSVLSVMPMDKSEVAMFYPQLSYRMIFPKNSEISDDRIFFESETSQNGTLLTVQIASSQDFTVSIHGTMHKEEKPQNTAFSFYQEKNEYLNCYESLLSGFKIEKQGSHETEVLNETAYWYAHNAMVHFIAPHGLEQPGGAAWGTRDICQGPFEFFIATQHFTLARSILLTLFSHQSVLSGEWPQWFMFDKYPDEMDGCHGDVVFWPLKCIVDYLTATGDYEVLQEFLPFTHAQTGGTLLE